jgi:hypothetical protein
MTISSKKKAGEEHSGSFLEPGSSLLPALLESCRAMLPLVSRHCAGDADAEAIIKAAERVIDRAEREARHTLKGGLQHRHGFFGRLGNHYDFEITISSVREKELIIRCEGQDRQGRRMVARIRKGDESLDAEAGDTIFFRGRVIAHRALFGEPVTHIEVTSGVMKIWSGI